MTSIGIDLGTSNSVASYVDENGKIQFIPNKQGNLTTPSVVRIEKGVVTVGEEALQDFKLGKPNVAGSFKVNMGSSKRYKLDGKEYSPTQLSSFVLGYLVECAEAHLGHKVKDAVITVPAYFEEPQRSQTIKAAEMVGLKVARIINEPTASALAYGMQEKEQGTLLVYDLGGGTFDISLLELARNEKTGKSTVEVIATEGDNRLGGDDFDAALSLRILHTLRKRDDYRPAFATVDRVVKEMSRYIKESLAESKSVELPLDLLKQLDPTFKPSKPTIKVTQAQYKTIVQEFIDRTISITKGLLEKQGMGEDEVDAIILVGGSTKSPLIKEALEEAFDIDILQSEVNPDLIVGGGAGVQASIIAGGVDDYVLLDVTPLNLIIERNDGLSSVVVKANTPIPTVKSKTYETSYDNQTEMEFVIYQGNNPIAKENTLLGTFKLTDLMPGPKASVLVELEFRINENGELSATATDIIMGNQVTVERIFSIK